MTRGFGMAAIGRNQRPTDRARVMERRCQLIPLATELFSSPDAATTSADFTPIPGLSTVSLGQKKAGRMRHRFETVQLRSPIPIIIIYYCLAVSEVTALS